MIALGVCQAYSTTQSQFYFLVGGTTVTTLSFSDAACSVSCSQISATVLNNACVSYSAGGTVQTQKTIYISGNTPPNYSGYGSLITSTLSPSNSGGYYSSANFRTVNVCYSNSGTSSSIISCTAASATQIALTTKSFVGQGTGQCVGSSTITTQVNL